MPRDTPALTPSRRQFLAALGATATATVAGCTDAQTDRPTTESGTTETTATPDYPATGDRVPELAPLDDAVREFAFEHDVPAATLAVAKDDDVVLERGYGYSDPGRSEQTPPDALFRIASLSKSFTSAATRSLFGDGLSPETRVLDVLDVEPADGLGDDRLQSVTVQHLLDHSAGWDHSAAADPMFHPFDVAEKLGLDEPPTTRDFARYVLGQPLQYEPGERHAYSNFGYALLGLVVEAESGQSLPAYVREQFFGGDPPDPLYEGRALPENRRDREVAYESAANCPNAAELDRNEAVPCSDGGFLVSAFGGAGGLVTSARTLVAFAADHRLDGFATAENFEYATAYGSLPGSYGMLQRRRDGVTVAVLFSDRGGSSNALADIQTTVNDAVADVDAWPSSDES
ncbi:serine hydrolase domain-containing protein [Halobacterium jilantaiense]|uniref:Beta-lactamase n=1 Tax=Halobacterium jilantaiense TaxID=355548 RepID=A0A1I0MFW0_9EURY|nr:serine hydrolase domain-containing protein [Halobacterium jilantaiense]SEV87139.1 Beta-lactamase [Halobacterium jilantaiense]